MDDYSSTGSPLHASTSSGTGLRLVLPPLKTVQALKGKKKQKGQHLWQDEAVKKPPRPVKLKPLREVLTKLIVQIKKKDDYAFFLHPVDTSQVAGYTDVVKRPMDLGTMTTKVERGKYRSLEEFADDLRLVTTNAKLFNPPGTIYHTEAERIEAWGLEHITKAAASVIEYETDWNIEIERDDNEEPDLGVTDKGTPMDVDDTASVTSLQTPVAQTPTQPGMGRRRVGGGGVKKLPGALSASLEQDGGLPGAKDGLGAFPPGSEWAELMLSLKLKGRRFRTKKERMRMERGGPPYRADGSLDYADLENPFSVLSFFVPEAPTRPILAALYPPSEQDQANFIPVNVRADPEAIPFLPSLAPTPLTGVSKAKAKPRRRHWLISHAPTRGRPKERDDEEEGVVGPVQRESTAGDYGAFAPLTGILGAERHVEDIEIELGSEEKLLDAIRESVERRQAGSQLPSVDMLDTDNPWQGTAEWAEEYLRDVVYGGVDGLAYVRSLAEFVRSPEPLEDMGVSLGHPALDMPLARWVEENVVEPLTDGRHRVLSGAARRLHDPQLSTDPTILAQLDACLKTYPRVARELNELRQTLQEKIDMAPLIRSPEELLQVEEVWEGKMFRDVRKQQLEAEREKELERDAAAYLKYAIEKHQEAQGQMQQGDVPEDSDLLQHVLDCAADAIAEISRRTASVGGIAEVKQEGREPFRRLPLADEQNVDVEMVVDEDAVQSDGLGEEDSLMKQLRMNLLALAKRASLDQIAMLPPELVPEHLRGVVPTVQS
ncbi:uncharacterized protein FIBRA_00014 [Fibroporia radiculosa]|uniref:Bromo domain-containing protein n=1 Tax=Fibroporia radiculosa TaxID=599839 RepID=J7SBQ1_9APHY|nr:uncharacterized protein FIBRA_00014 [Fibroporia radiculosa]CCL98021.1 predicted protein [Fibroporia radiculosa]